MYSQLPQSFLRTQNSIRRNDCRLFRYGKRLMKEDLKRETIADLKKAKIEEVERAQVEQKATARDYAEKCEVRTTRTLRAEGTEPSLFFNKLIKDLLQSQSTMSGYPKTLHLYFQTDTNSISTKSAHL